LETFEGSPIGKDRSVGIVCSRFNEEVTSKLLAGAVEALERAGVAPERIFVALVPGAVELPLAARRLARHLELDAVVALGAVIRGETSHYDVVCRASQEGLTQVGLELDIPVLLGVLTCETVEQALARAGGGHGNKGAVVALDALRMADLFDRILEIEP
jgi:6,7-dimethyl-8-ribityllumazine synthase